MRRRTDRAVQARCALIEAETAARPGGVRAYLIIRTLDGGAGGGGVVVVVELMPMSLPSLAALSPGDPAFSCHPAHAAGDAPPVKLGVPITLLVPVAPLALSNSVNRNVHPLQPLPFAVFHDEPAVMTLFSTTALVVAELPTLLSNDARTLRTVLCRNTGLAALPN